MCSVIQMQNKFLLFPKAENSFRKSSCYKYMKLIIYQYAYNTHMQHTIQFSENEFQGNVGIAGNQKSEIVFKSKQKYFENSY